MATRSFIDTNLLIYAEASDAPVKQRVALDLMKRLYDESQGVLSTQVLQEYCNVALKKLRLPARHVRAQLELYGQFEVIQVTPAIIQIALDLHETRRIASYDAIIVATAQTAGCDVVLSEDMDTGESLAGVRIVNPFADAQALTPPTCT